MDEWNASGAVLVGRRTAEQIDHWSGDHHGVPVFVPSHRPPGPSVANWLCRWSLRYPAVVGSSLDRFGLGMWQQHHLLAGGIITYRA